LIKSIFWYVANGHKSSAIMPSSASAVLRIAGIAGTAVAQMLGVIELAMPVVLGQHSFELHDSTLQVLHQHGDFVQRVGVQYVSHLPWDERKSPPVSPWERMAAGKTIVLAISITLRTLSGLIVHHFGQSAGFVSLAGEGLLALVILAVFLPETREAAN
jgi:hypothetical protein